MRVGLVSDPDSFPFEVLSTADLVVDRVYLGGPRAKFDDALSRLMGVRNSGGFRPAGSIVKGDVRYVALFTTGLDPDWPDTVDKQTGTAIYHGDQKRPGKELHDTPGKGNVFLRDVFRLAEEGPDARATVPPLFMFASTPPGKSVVFLGLLAPGGPGIRADERLVAIWKSQGGRRYLNYRAVFTVLASQVIPRAWLNDLRAGVESPHAPKEWTDWVTAETYAPLAARPNRHYRTPAEQVPTDAEGVRMLQAIVSHFADEPTAFEPCAVKLWQMMAPATTEVVVTRAVVDGGRDAIGSYVLGPVGDRISLTFSLEAKCYASTTRVKVKDAARLISRIRHREFGVLITTSVVDRQAYEEIRSDQHPVVIVCGRDIVETLRERGLTTTAGVKLWLATEFPRTT